MRNFNFFNIIYGLIMRDLVWVRVKYIPYGLCFKRDIKRYSEAGSGRWKIKILRGK